MHVISWTLFHQRYFTDTDQTRFGRRTFSIAAHRLKFLCTLHKTSRSHVHNSAAYFYASYSAAAYQRKAPIGGCLEKKLPDLFRLFTNISLKQNLNAAEKGYFWLHMSYFPRK
jgi:hypothetical protein